jgi:putative transposase
LRPTGPTPVVRSDNGLIYQSRRFRTAGRDYRLRQEFITPYTQGRTGFVGRFFRSRTVWTIATEPYPEAHFATFPSGRSAAWQRVFRDFTEARREITAWIRWHNIERPHQALGHRSPTEWRAQQCSQVA